MTAKRHERTRARRAALQVLYTSEITEASPTAIAESGEGRLAEDGPLPDYALTLVRGCLLYTSDAADDRTCV